MLQLRNICKSYTTGNFTQVALDNVSISFRDSEFAAILGPSGSGKTTLLNIIGGLDHYDSGDLIIDGISTKDYTDHDWDTFRNNRIGFVFQSYNLIPHQSVLANVELALTLSGVSREERRERAIAELERVGLKDHINKKPSQLSGGQMQRVAIARALVNDPEILLADEPTGALDSKTSVQIMDLLTEIARDRLVIMVTHNPELADEYATRIVNFSDGHVIADSQPFDPSPSEIRKSRKKIRRTSMSFLTALGLSFNNLMTKKGRTIMTAFAGSIGIIGISSILALANGVNSYIESVEEETLSSYPLQITSTGFDMTSMMVSSMSSTDSGDAKEDADQGDDATVGEISIVNRMFDSVGSNDLASLKAYLQSDESDIWNYAKDIEYEYNVTPQIFIEERTSEAADDTNDEAQAEDRVPPTYRQINPDTTLSSMGMGTSVTSSAVMSTMMSTDIFAQLMGNLDMAKESYDLKAGHWPESYNECILVLSQSGKVSDFFLYVLGLRDKSKLDEMVRAFVNEEEVETEVNDGATFTYKDFLDLRMKLVCSADFYQYDSNYGVWVDKSGDEDYMEGVIAQSDDLVISAIVQPKEDSSSMSSSGIYYTPELINHLIDEASQTQIVKDQLADPTIDIFNGKPFAEEEDEGSDFDMSKMFTVDTDALSAAFSFDPSKMQLDLSGLSIDFDSSSLPAPPEMDMSQMMGSGSDMTMDPTVASQMAKSMLEGYMQAMATNPGMSIDDYMALPETQQMMSGYIKQLIGPMQQGQAQAVSQYMQTYMQSYMDQTMGAVASQMSQATQMAMSRAMSSLGSSMSSAMSVSEDAFMNAFKFNLDEDDLTELIRSMMMPEEASFDSNLAQLNYAFLDKPFEIDIFAQDFEAKQGIIDILDSYNDEMNSTGQESKAITYTDIVGALMSSVTTIIDMISYVLIAFVSISLIVSSIMIGVITYISVLERKKEIGILRAIGASKGNISEVFNAETVIEGLIAGLMGVGITAICCIPASAIVYALFDVPNVASLPWQAALILIAISVFLTFIAGLIPASSASRKDPVEALRSE